MYFFRPIFLLITYALIINIFWFERILHLSILFASAFSVYLNSIGYENKLKTY